MYQQTPKLSRPIPGPGRTCPLLPPPLGCGAHQEQNNPRALGSRRIDDNDPHDQHRDKRRTLAAAGPEHCHTLIADSLLRPPDSLLPAFPGAEEDSGLSKARSRPRARRVPLAAQALYHAPRTTQDPMVRIQSVPAATLLQPGSFASHLPSSTLPPPATRGAATTKLSEKHKKDARERERKEGKEGSEGVLQTVIKSAAAS